MNTPKKPAPRRAPNKGGKFNKPAQAVQKGPRLAAAHLLARVLDKGQPLDMALNSGLRGLEGRDRAFARALASITLRNLGVIDHLIEPRLKTPISERAHIARDALRLGLAEILFLRTPTHAAVSEAVSLVGTDAASRPLKGVVNAVMRRLSEQGESILQDLDTDRLNTPDWLFDKWQAAYGEETARAIAAAHRAEAPLDLTVKENAAGFAGRLGGEVVGPHSVRLGPDHAAIDSLPGYESGAFWVQDLAAALPVHLMGDLEDKTVLDMCAAPGGKTMQLAAAGAHVLAVDKSEPRLDRVAENLERTGLPADLLCTDATQLDELEPFDAVLLDAPCSATGTIRRHPDLPWIRDAEMMTAFPHLQTKLLNAAAKLVKPGGMLVYAVCSLEPEEGPARIEKFLAAHGDFTREAVRAAEVAHCPEVLCDNGDIRSLPSHLAEKGGMDGFFIARLRRNA